MSPLPRFGYHLTEKGRFESFTAHMLGYPLVVGSIAMGICFDILGTDGPGRTSIHLSALALLAAGLVCLFMFKGRRPRASVGIMTILLMYALSVAMAALPYMLYGIDPRSAVFEAVSGITTTGMSVIRLSAMDRALLIWRAVTGWLGGFMFISLFSLYISDFGIPGRYIFSSGSASVDSDLYKPQVMKIALRYGEVYIASTILMSVLLVVTGTGSLDAISLAMSTVSTTGFIDFHGGLSELTVMSRVVIAVFMFIAMFNFTTTFFALVRRTFRPFRQDNETIYMLSWMVLVGAVVFTILFQYGYSPNDAEEFLDFILVVLSAASTTGFMVSDYSWPAMAVVALCLVSIVGGSIDSPTGGIKVSRAAMVLKIMKNHVNEAGFPNEVTAIRVRNVNVARALAHGALLTSVLFVSTLVIGTILIMIDGLDMVSSFYVATSAITTTGKGIFSIGDLDSIDNNAKIVCSALMIAGRLEIIPFLMLLSPEFWRDLFRGRVGIRQRVNGRRLRSLQRRGSRDRHR